MLPTASASRYSHSKSGGAIKGLQPIKVDQNAFKAEYKAWCKGDITALKAMEHLGLKPNTFYRRVREYENQAN